MSYKETQSLFLSTGVINLFQKISRSIFRCNRLDGCIFRNRIFTHSLTHSLTALSSLQGILAEMDGLDKRTNGKRDNGTMGQWDNGTMGQWDKGTKG